MRDPWSTYSLLAGDQIEDIVVHNQGKDLFSSQLKVMESRASVPGPMPLISEGLRIIEHATGVSGKLLMNKRQCESLTHRLYSIGEELKELAKLEYVGRTSVDADSKVGYSSFEMLLTVLKKAEALLMKYRESSASIPSALTRREDRGAFKEIHEELDMLNSFFHFESFVYVASESEKNAMLTENADEDLKELSTSLDGLAQSGESRQALELATNLEKVKLVISERSEGTSDDGLPSYLNIDPASVEIKDPVRMPERLSNHDDTKTDGWALVRFGAYLGCDFALKVFSSGDTTWNRTEHLKELRSLMALHHPHVVQLMGFAQDEEKCIILMELMDTDLRHFMKLRLRDWKQPFSRSEEMDIIAQIAKGMYYLHEQQYVHGELKCSNILVKQIGDHIDVKVSDLRSSQKLGVWDPVLFRDRSTRGRARWAAPEVKSYGEKLHPSHELLKKTDVYSFGMVCFEVVTGKLPFQDIFGDELKTRIETGELKQELPGELDDSLRGLIESCWERDPNNRPTFKEICHLLDFIRSSQPAVVSSLSSGKDHLLHVLKLISKTVWPGLEGSEVKNDPSWGHTSGQESTVADCDSYNAITVPDFVKIHPANLKKGPLIGKGGYAEVYEVTWLGCKFATKTFKISSPIAVQRELMFLITLRHPSIVRLIGLAVHSMRRCSIVMECMGCDLRERIKSNMKLMKRDTPFEFHEAVYIITKIALGMAFLHSKGVAHRDLKASNVLLPIHSASIDVKITDFGVSQLIDSSEENHVVIAGTSFWRAPEMFRDNTKSYDLKAADVYSFAMTCYEVVTGKIPMEDQILEGLAAVKSKVVDSGFRPTLPSNLNAQLKLLIEQCWDGVPEKRPTFQSVCQKLQLIQQELRSASAESVYS